jgi:hypothetical protein
MKQFFNFACDSNRHSYMNMSTMPMVRHYDSSRYSYINTMKIDCCVDSSRNPYINTTNMAYLDIGFTLGSWVIAMLVNDGYELFTQNDYLFISSWAMTLFVYDTHDSIQTMNKQTQISFSVLPVSNKVQLIDRGTQTPPRTLSIAHRETQTPPSTLSIAHRETQTSSSTLTDALLDENQTISLEANLSQYFIFNKKPNEDADEQTQSWYMIDKSKAF